MFSETKLIIGGVVALLIAAAVFIFIHRGHEVQHLQQTVQLQQFQNGNLQQTVEDGAKSKAISDNTAMTVQQAADNTVAAQDQIQESEQTQEAAVRQHYAARTPRPVVRQALPVAKVHPAAETAEDVARPVVTEAPVHTEEQDAISGVRLKSLWQSYCQATGGTNVPECQAK